MDMVSGNLSSGAGNMGHPTSNSTTNANYCMSSSNFPGSKETISMTLSTSLDAMFKRKRGRPPKNRVVEVIYLLIIFYNYNSYHFKFFAKAIFWPIIKYVLLIAKKLFNVKNV